MVSKDIAFGYLYPLDRYSLAYFSVTRVLTNDITVFTLKYEVIHITIVIAGDMPPNKGLLCIMRRRTPYSRKHSLEAFLERSDWSTTRLMPSVSVRVPGAVQ